MHTVLLKNASVFKMVLWCKAVECIFHKGWKLEIVNSLVNKSAVNLIIVLF